MQINSGYEVKKLQKPLVFREKYPYNKNVIIIRGAKIDKIEGEMLL